MAALPDLMTVARFGELPEKAGYKYELQHGEMVAVPLPKFKHSKL